MAEIKQRGRNKWFVRVFLGRDPQTGKSVCACRTITGNKKDAEQWAIEAERERDLGGGLASKATVDGLLESLKLDYRINGKNYHWAERIVRVNLMPYFGKMRIAKVTTDTVNRYMAARQTDGIANSTLNRELALLKRAFNLGRKCTPPKVTKALYIPHLRENNIRTGFIEDAQYRNLMAALAEHVRPVLAFGYFTGCRRGEILSLEWPQVDLVGRVVRLECDMTKNDEAREIPLVPELYDILAIQRERRDRLFPECPWVFFGETGEQIRDFRDAWESACKAAGLVDSDGEAAVIFHDLRRSGVRNLIRAGVPEAVAMRISGHKTRSIFDRYNIVNNADLKDAARKLAEYTTDRRKRDEEAARSAKSHTIVTQGRPKGIQ
mgnify:CR=1 FL=1